MVSLVRLFLGWVTLGTLKWVAVATGLASSINGKYNRTAMCLYNVMGWGVVSKACKCGKGHEAKTNSNQARFNMSFAMDIKLEHNGFMIEAVDLISKLINQRSKLNFLQMKSIFECRNMSELVTSEY